jgi:hypothetical protein
MQICCEMLDLVINTEQTRKKKREREKREVIFVLITILQISIGLEFIKMEKITFL